MKPDDTGLGLSSADVGFAGAIYVAGACVGALLFGTLTDRLGRKELFVRTLGAYTVATVLTAFSMNPRVVRLPFPDRGRHRGDYPAISTIDELVPCQVPRTGRRRHQRLILGTLAQFDPAQFSTGGAGFLTIDEESSGIIDAEAATGRAGTFYFDAQVHTADRAAGGHR